MTPRILGSGMSGVEVINITKHGIWLVTRDHELFISFKEFPWFRDVTVRKLMNVEQSTPARLYWQISALISLLNLSDVSHSC